MKAISTLKPIWELLNIICNWAMGIVGILFACVVVAIVLYHRIIESCRDDIEKNIVYRKRLKISFATFVPIFAIAVIIKVILLYFLD